MLNRSKKGPDILVFFTNYICNSRCLMCNIWEKQGEDNVLNINQIENFFDNYLIKNFVKIVNLTGGEPTLDEKLEDIVKIILRKCKKIKRVDIPTNGIDTEIVVDKIERILALLFPYQNVRLTATIALDGIGKTHETIRGRTGIFENVIVTIKELKELAKLYPYFSLSLNTVVNRINYDKLDEVIDFAKREQLYLNLTPVAVSEIGVESINASGDFSLNKAQKLDVIKAVNKLDEVQYLSPVNKKFLIDTLNENKRGIDCVFRQKKAILIEPNGDIYLCGNFKSFALGNIAIDKFEQLWGKAKLPENWRNICSKCGSNCYLDEL